MYICVLCLKLDVNATKAPHSTARHPLHSALDKQTDLNYYTTTISHAFHIMILPLLSVYHFCCCRLNTYHQDPLLAPPTLCPSVPFNDQRHQTQTILSSLTITRDNNNSVKVYYAIFKNKYHYSYSCPTVTVTCSAPCRNCYPFKEPTPSLPLKIPPFY